MNNDYDENDDGQYVDEEDWYNDDFWEGAPSRIYQTSGPMDPEFLRAWRKRIRSIYKPEVMRKLGRDMNNRPLKPQPISDQTLTDPNVVNPSDNTKPPSKWGSYHDGFRMREFPEDKKDWSAYQWGKHLGVTNLPPSEYLFDREDDPVSNSQAINLQGKSLEGDGRWNMKSMIPETQYGYTQIADNGQPRIPPLPSGAPGQNGGTNSPNRPNNNRPLPPNHPSNGQPVPSGYTSDLPPNLQDNGQSLSPPQGVPLANSPQGTQEPNTSGNNNVAAGNSADSPVRNSATNRLPMPWEFQGRHDLTHLAVIVNENGKDEFYSGGSDKSKITFSKYGLDLGNTHAIAAFQKLVDAAKENGKLKPEDEAYLNLHNQDEDPSDEVVQRFQTVLGPTLISAKGQKIIEEAVKGAKKDNEAAIDFVNSQSLRDRGRILNPIEHANLAIWSNRSDGLGYTSESWDNGKIKADSKNIGTKDLLNWIKGQKNFDSRPGDKPEDKKNKRNQWKQHLINIGTAVQRGIGAGIIQSGDITRESQDALNAVLKEAGSDERFSFVAE